MHEKTGDKTTFRAAELKQDVRQDYVGNCADKIKVGQEVMVMVCSHNGQIDILRTSDFVVIGHQGPQDVEDQFTGHDIAIIEHNVDLNGMKAAYYPESNQNLNEANGWMNDYINIKQSLVVVTMQGETPQLKAWEILQANYRSSATARLMVFSTNNLNDILPR